jgi:hypothetical protein
MKNLMAMDINDDAMASAMLATPDSNDDSVFSVESQPFLTS